jgi:hypothetical protein
VKFAKQKEEKHEYRVLREIVQYGFVGIDVECDELFVGGHHRDPHLSSPIESGIAIKRKEASICWNWDRFSLE